MIEKAIAYAKEIFFKDASGHINDFRQIQQHTFKPPCSHALDIIATDREFVKYFFLKISIILLYSGTGNDPLKGDADVVFASVLPGAQIELIFPALGQRC